MGNPLGSNDLDREVSSAIEAELEKSGMSLRALSRTSGVKLTRLGDILRRGKAMTVGELAALCAALGLRASEVIREAEAVVAARAREEERERLLADLAAGVPVESLGLAASRHPEAEAERRERVGLPVVGPEDVSQDTGGDEPA